MVNTSRSRVQGITSILCVLAFFGCCYSSQHRPVGAVRNGNRGGGGLSNGVGQFAKSNMAPLELCYRVLWANETARGWASPSCCNQSFWPRAVGAYMAVSICSCSMWCRSMQPKYHDRWEASPENGIGYASIMPSQC